MIAYSQIACAPLVSLAPKPFKPRHATQANSKKIKD